MPVDMPDWTSAVASPSKVIATLTTGGGLWTSSAQSVPNGAIALMVQWSASAALSGTVLNFKLTGVQTGTNYFNASQGLFSGSGLMSGFVCYVSPQDTTFTVTTNFSGATSVYVTALYVPVTETTQGIVGVISAQPVAVEETSGVSGSATTVPIANAVGANVPLNLTAVQYNIRGFQISGAPGAAGDVFSVVSFGASPINISLFCAPATPWSGPSVDTHRLTAWSGFKFNGGAHASTWYGCFYVDQDQ